MWERERFIVPLISMISSIEGVTRLPVADTSMQVDPFPHIFAAEKSTEYTVGASPGLACRLVIRSLCPRLITVGFH